MRKDNFKTIVTRACGCCVARPFANIDSWLDHHWKHCVGDGFGRGRFTFSTMMFNLLQQNSTSYHWQVLTQLEPTPFESRTAFTWDERNAEVRALFHALQSGSFQGDSLRNDDVAQFVVMRAFFLAVKQSDQPQLVPSHDREQQALSSLNTLRQQNQTGFEMDASALGPGALSQDWHRNYNTGLAKAGTSLIAPALGNDQEGYYTDNELFHESEIDINKNESDNIDDGDENDDKNDDKNTDYDDDDEDDGNDLDDQKEGEEATEEDVHGSSNSLGYLGYLNWK